MRQGTTQYIEQCTGKIVRRSEDRFSARRATADESRILDSPRGGPVLCGQHRLLDAKGDVIEFGESVRPSGEWTSTFEGVVRP